MANSKLNIDGIQKAQKAGRIIGLTDNDGAKYNGQVQCVGEVSLMIYDRNAAQNVVLRHDEIKSVRCGATNT